MTSAQEIIRTLGMQPHPEGGWFVQTFVDEDGPDGRARSTLIYYLLEHGQKSHWHRVDAAEVWHYYAGDPLELRISDGLGLEIHTLGNAIGEGQRPQVVVPKGAWQAARSSGAFTLVGCTVAPGFLFAGFELAAPDWEPGLG